MDERSRHDDNLMRAVVPAMSAYIGDHAFSEDGDGRWARAWGWKLDLIEVTPLLSSVVVNFYIEVPCRPAPEVYDTLEMEGLGYVLGKGRSDLEVPAFRPVQFVARDIVNSLGQGLSWFDRFATRALCLDALLAGKKNKSSQSYRDCERYLRELSATFDVPCCATGG